MKILIIDDSILDRKLTIKHLNALGFTNEILQAGNGQAGLEVISENLSNISLILLDREMPTMEGLEFMTILRQNTITADIPIIMLTVEESSECIERCYTVNPDLKGYIVKPYERHELKETITPYVDL